jgi:hypothetical protein
MGTGCVFLEVKRPEILLTDYFLPMSRLRMSGTTLSDLASNLVVMCMDIMYVCMCM